MAPIATDAVADSATTRNEVDITALKKQLAQVKLDNARLILPPDNTLKRYLKAGIDLSNGYPYFPPKPEFVEEVFTIRTDLRKYVDPATRADPAKHALLGAATKVVNITTHIGVSGWPHWCFF